MQVNQNPDLKVTLRRIAQCCIADEDRNPEGAKKYDAAAYSTIEKYLGLTKFARVPESTIGRERMNFRNVYLDAKMAIRETRDKATREEAK